MNWNPMMGPLGASLIPQQYQANQLGAAPTLGNQQAQDHYRQLAEAFVMQQRAAQEQELAKAISGSGWVDRSGPVGVLNEVFKAYVGKKLSKRADEKDIAAREAYYKGQSAAEQEKARREVEAAHAERARREEEAKRFGLEGRDAVRYALEGKLGELPAITPMMTDQGLVGVRRDGTYEVLSPSGLRATPQNVRIDPALANNPEAIGAPAGDQGYQVQAQRPLMPYRDPAEAARQAAGDARANVQLGLALRADERAQAEAERKAAEARAAESAKSNVLDQWKAARQGLESGLANTETGPIMGRIPAFTTEQQIAEGAVSATAPILKQIFRSAGEGTFTDKDQELLLRMVPTRTDTPKARAAKVENIDRIIRAKVGQGGSSQPTSGGVDDLLSKYGVK